ncbi:two-component system sensor histidine kinase MtrB [Nocardioides luteus]|uniref:Sensor histidine kinase MtrB n=1 Tax=Nocardioides luteus TaxID=1844 RepID=A0ABQ5SWI7_9ACTN|nr:MtrAB system histidine kinase MtrB [Nocardioides luteus]MDR7311951.1 two-component system sensor histidine kinase MtrB [Nocardioides luteus]GGR68451.1 two-component sensor histidine kinase [Nocardioides luteus]GLJ68194.1 two-component sensor histidine kinase [Nocardioides luteus]
MTLQQVVRAAARTPKKLLTIWRRSIQTRVVVYTVLLTAAAVSVVGLILLDQIGDELVQDRVAAAKAEASEELSAARSSIAETSGDNGRTPLQRNDLGDPIIQRSLSRGYGVVMAGPVTSTSGRISDDGVEWTPGLDVTSVPRALEDRFQSIRAEPAWTYTRISFDEDGDRSSVPGIVIGSQVELHDDTYNIYFLFPMDQEQETLAIITRGLLAAGVLLILLIGIGSWIVTRHVVTPIRIARRTAERLAAGRLEERMVVHGEDDLTGLAISFNQMASGLQNQIRQLEHLSRVQRRFSSDVSHELRTPLTTVRMASDVLHEARDTFDAPTARAAELLQTELDRFETLLSDLLEISRFDAGAAVLDLYDTDLTALAEAVVEAHLPLAEKRDIELKIVAPDHPCIAQVDHRRIERVVRNLVANAVDHALIGQTVTIRLDSDEHAAALTVRDHGVGLAPGETALVFNRFWRADPARDRSSGGTGLGLSISLEDAHLHGGWLQAWGRPNQGAQFRLTLPRYAGTALRYSPLPLVPADARDTLEAS